MSKDRKTEIESEWQVMHLGEGLKNNGIKGGRGGSLNVLFRLSSKHEGKQVN